MFPELNMPNHQRSLLIVSDPCDIERVTAAFHRIVDEPKRWKAQLAERIHQSLSTDDVLIKFVPNVQFMIVNC